MRPSRRRALLSLGSLAAASWAPALLAQDARKSRHVAILASGGKEAFGPRAKAFREAMAKLGHAEDRGVRYSWHYADGHHDRLRALAQEIVKSAPEVIVASSSITTRPLFQATAAIPVVMANADDPVADRFVKATDKTASNITGVLTARVDDVIQAAHWLGRVMPAGGAFGVLLDQANVNYRSVRSRMHYAAQQEKRPLVYLDAPRVEDLERAFKSLGAEKVAGLVVMDDPFFLDEAARIVKLVAASKRPAIYGDRAFVTAGGLMSYGGDALAAMARAAGFVDRILKGAHPSELPMEAPPPFELVVNRATAKAMKVALPQDVAKAARLV